MEETRILIKKRLSGKLLKECADLYLRAFASAALNSPVRQSFTAEELAATLRSHHVLKFVLLSGERAVGVGLLTNRFNRVYWVNYRYFKHNFPELYRQGKIYFIEGVAIDPDFQEKSLSIRILLAFGEFLAKDGALAVFDMAEKIYELGLPGTAARAANPISYMGKMIERQTFFLYTPGKRTSEE